MRLKALDQIHISAVQADSLRPGQEFEVGDDLGATLLKAKPAVFAQLPDLPAEKAAPEPLNKAEPAPPNKAAPRAKSKPKAK